MTPKSRHIEDIFNKYIITGGTSRQLLPHLPGDFLCWGTGGGNTFHCDATSPELKRAAGWRREAENLGSTAPICEILFR